MKSEGIMSEMYRLGGASRRQSKVMPCRILFIEVCSGGGVRGSCNAELAGLLTVPLLEGTN